MVSAQRFPLNGSCGGCSWCRNVQPCVAVVRTFYADMMGWRARVAELVDAAGLKPAAHPDGSVRVRVPSRAPRLGRRGLWRVANTEEQHETHRSRVEICRLGLFARRAEHVAPADIAHQFNRSLNEAWADQGDSVSVALSGSGAALSLSSAAAWQALARSGAHRRSGPSIPTPRTAIPHCDWQRISPASHKVIPFHMARQ